jgi:hypothetical protein
MAIPFERLRIPKQLQRAVGSNAPRAAKVAVAKGLLPATADVQLALLYVLAADPDAGIAEMARETLTAMPTQQVLAGISQETFPKILEFLAEFRVSDKEIDERLVQIRGATTRAVVRIAERADANMCETLCLNQERLLLSPEVYVALHANPACSSDLLAGAAGFLRMHDCLPVCPDRRPFEPEPSRTVADIAPSPAAPVAPRSSLSPTPIGTSIIEAAAPPPPQQGTGEKLAMFDLDAAAAGTDVPFEFNFEDNMAGFSWDLTGDKDGDDEPEEDRFLSMEKRIADMSVGEKIKLAYLGNRQARRILVRDSNKVVASAVVKSGRLTDTEVAAFAGNRNLPDDVLREISSNKAWTRKYPVKVALVNNPKTPAKKAMKILVHLHRKDLQQLSTNNNVPSVIKLAARKLFNSKYRK